MEQAPIAAARAARVEIEREALLDGLKLLSRLVERRNTIPILSNVLLETGFEGGLCISATDLDIQARLELAARSEAPISLTVGAAAFLDAIKKTNKGAVIALEPADGRLTVSAGRVRVNLQTLPSADFPLLEPILEPVAAFDLDGETFAADLRQLAPVMSRDESRYYLQGALLERTGGRLCLVATDGSNAAVIDRPAPLGSDCVDGLIMSRKACDFVARAVDYIGADVGPVALTFGDRAFKVSFPGLTRAPNLTIWAKLIDGSFPNWRCTIEAAMGNGPLAELSPILEALEPRTNPKSLALLSKGLPKGAAVDVLLGEQCAMLTSEHAPAWTGFSMMMREAGTAPKGYSVNGRDGAVDGITRYGQALAEAAGLPTRYVHRFKGPQGEPRASSGDPQHIVRGGLVRAILVGKSEEIETPAREELCWETLTTRQIPATRETVYAEGACCVLIPASHAVDVSLDYEGRNYPLATNAAGELALTEEQIRVLAGPVDPSEHVAIPRFTFWQGAIIAIDGVATDGTGRLVSLPAAVAKSKRNDRAAMTAAEIARRLDAARPVYFAAPSEAELAPEPEPVDEAEPVAIEPEPVKAQEEALPVERHISPPDALDAPAAPIPAAEEPETVQTSEPVASVDIAARVQALESAVQALQAGRLTIAPAIEAQPVDRSPARLRMIRRYLAMRRDRAELVAALDAQEARLALAAADYADSQASREEAWRDAVNLKAELEETKRANALACKAAVAAQEAQAAYQAEAERSDKAAREARDAAALASDRLKEAQAEAAAAMELLTEESARADRLQAQVDQLKARKVPAPVVDQARARFQVVN